jgi:hypothetical protein
VVALPPPVPNPPDPVPDLLDKIANGKTVSRFLRSNQIMHRRNYRSLFGSGEMEPVMTKLSEEDLEPGFITRAHGRLDPRIGTLRHWRRALLDNAFYRPYCTRANDSKRALTKAQEQRVRDKMQTGYIKKKRYCPPLVLQYLAVCEYRSGSREDDPI